MTLRILCADGTNRERAVAAGLAATRRGDLVLIPTETVYAIATDAFSRRGVSALREAKGYDDQVPLPVLVGARSTVPGVAARVGDDARALMDAFWPGLLTLLLPPQPTLAWDLPNGAPLAVRMPLHPVALALLAASGPLVVTTANLRGLPAPADVDDALAQLGDSVALALDAGDLTDESGLPSTVVDLTGDAPRVVRMGSVSLDALRGACPAVLDEHGSPGA
ncbi:MAG: threonylcarbamoyl-AMP synthase [Actinobacteria bacterium]|nr:threonylcarbamoyl-AMP synthase [Actinomycetota bacterium]